MVWWRFGFGVALAVILVVPFLARAQDTTPDTGDETPAVEELFGTPDATPHGTPDAGTTVTIVDFKFEPATTEIAVGDTVTWVNDGPTAHTSTSFGEGGKKVWDSNILSRGDDYSFTFEEAGSFDYVCSLHPSMKARIVVE